MDFGTVSALVFLAVLVALSAYFSATETAFSALNRVRIKTKADDGDARAQLTLSLSEQYDRLLSTILIGNNIVNIGAATLGTVICIKWFQDAGATISTIAVTIIVLIFGEITPKSFAKDHPERFAMFSAPILRVLMWVLTPLNALFAGWKKLVTRGKNRGEEHPMTQDELLTLVEEVEQEGGLAKEDGELLRSAIEFTDLCADDILTHRTDLEAVPDTASKEEVARVFSESRYSRLLVYSGDIDNIVGVIHQKDFYVGTGVTSKELAQIMTEPLFVANSAKISDLLKLLQRQKAHIAVVTDEYGGTLGIVTMEDILEELVGDIWDEHDEVIEAIHKVGDDAYRVLGTAYLEDLFDFLSIHDEETESVTVSGWVMERLGRIPRNGESFHYDGWTLTATKTDPRHVWEVEVRKVPVEQTVAV
ncbi:MAG: HlyC/CorC family transporter [Candidatus Spyradocola sp.]|jgi:putative hemolysin